jgi:hypothetical protein
MDNHFHAQGDTVLDGYKPIKNKPNSACRCAEHIARPLKATRAVESCELECWMCQQARVIRERLAK